LRSKRRCNLKGTNDTMVDGPKINLDGKMGGWFEIRKGGSDHWPFRGGTGGQCRGSGHGGVSVGIAGESGKVKLITFS